MALERMASLSKRTTNMSHKIPYVDLISDAILESPDRRLTAKEIFDYVTAKYGPVKSAETLKNTIRHTLSRYKIFYKIQRGKQKKPNWWTVDDATTHSDYQVEHLQRDAELVIRAPISAAVATPEVITVSPFASPENAHNVVPANQQSQHVELGNQIDFNTNTYGYQSTTYQQFYYSEQQNASNETAPEGVGVNVKHEVEENTYRLLQLDGNEDRPGTSRNVYDLGYPGDSSYLYPGQGTDMGPNTTNGQTQYSTSTETSRPEYYQM